jgi:hypothetical protein
MYSAHIVWFMCSVRFLQSTAIISQKSINRLVVVMETASILWGTNWLYIHYLDEFQTCYLAFNLPYVYDYIIKLCRQQAEVVQNYENEHVCSRGHGESRHTCIRSLTLAAVKLTTVQVTKLPPQLKICKINTMQSLDWQRTVCSAQGTIFNML